MTLTIYKHLGSVWDLLILLKLKTFTENTVDKGKN